MKYTVIVSPIALNLLMEKYVRINAAMAYFLMETSVKYVLLDVKLVWEIYIISVQAVSKDIIYLIKMNVLKNV